MGRRRSHAAGSASLRAIALWAAVALLGGCPDEASPGPSFEIVHEALPGGLFSVWGTSATDVWAVGGDAEDDPIEGPTVLHWNGAEWSRHSTGTEGDLWWVHGIEGGPILMGGEGGQILRYEGGTFDRMDTPGTGTVFGIWGSEPNDVWAVGGSNSVGSAFVWRWDGTAWSDVPLPDGLADPQSASVFKVWGTAADDVWLVGSGGLLMHWDGSGLRPVDSGTSRPIFTVHARGDRVAAVGGLGTGVLVERDPASGAWMDTTPPTTPQMIGVWLTDEGGWAVGIYGAMLRLMDGGWVEEDTGLALAESLHGVWVDPEGGVWAVGGQVLTDPPVQGLLLYAGTQEMGDGIGED